MKYLRVNWDKLTQREGHRDGSYLELPAWLPDDAEFAALPDLAKAHLVSIWILAMRMEGPTVPGSKRGLIAADPALLGRLIRAQARVDVELLVARGFLVRVDGDTAEGKPGPGGPRSGRRGPEPTSAPAERVSPAELQFVMAVRETADGAGATADASSQCRCSCCCYYINNNNKTVATTSSDCTASTTPIYKQPPQQQATTVVGRGVVGKRGEGRPATGALTNDPSPTRRRRKPPLTAQATPGPTRATGETPDPGPGAARSRARPQAPSRPDAAPPPPPREPALDAGAVDVARRTIAFHRQVWGKAVSVETPGTVAVIADALQEGYSEAHLRCAIFASRWIADWFVRNRRAELPLVLRFRPEDGAKRILDALIQQAASFNYGADALRAERALKAADELELWPDLAQIGAERPSPPAPPEQPKQGAGTVGSPEGMKQLSDMVDALIASTRLASVPPEFQKKACA